MENKKYGHLGTDFENHFIIVGWDSFGQNVADQIVKSGHKVAIVCNKKDDIDLIIDSYLRTQVNALYADYNNLDAFKKVNIEQSSTVFINFANDTDTLVYVLNLKKRYPNIEIVVSLDNPDLKETYQAIGINNAISRNDIAAKLVASYIFEPDVANITDDLMTTTNNTEDYDIQEYRVIDKNPYLNHDYLDAFIDLKTKHDCVLLGLVKKEANNWKLIKNPRKGMKIELDDYLIIMMNGIIKSKISELFKTEEGRKIARK